MRQIKASEVKPGMKIRWDSGENTYQCKVDKVTPSIAPGVVILDATDGSQFRVGGTPQITVMSEPRPEEPTTFGARVTVDGLHFVRADDDGAPWKGEGEPSWWHWNDLCELGPVQVVPDPSWAVPDNSPEALDRIEEWDTWEDVPEGVVVTVPDLFCQYRKNQGVVEFNDPDTAPDWTKPCIRTMPREYGPWTRVTDA